MLALFLESSAGSLFDALPGCGGFKVIFWIWVKLCHSIIAVIFPMSHCYISFWIRAGEFNYLTYFTTTFTQPTLVNDEWKVTTILHQNSYTDIKGIKGKLQCRNSHLFRNSGTACLQGSCAAVMHLQHRLHPSNDKTLHKSQWKSKSLPSSTS